jgi:phage gp36-like protein
MPYATFDDVLNRYPPAKTMVGSGVNEVSTADISSLYVFGAEGIVNGYVGAKYTTPIAMPEALITQVTADISIYKLCEDKMPRIPEFAERRYKHAIEILEMIRDGKMVLSSSATLIVGGGDNEAWSSTGSFHPVFSTVLGELEQKVDRDQVREEKSIRSTDF